jgi:hypothetical protein
VTVACGLTVAVGCAGSNDMEDDEIDGIWDAADMGDLGEVERLVGQSPDALEHTDCDGWTPLFWASQGGHLAVVRYLLDKGAAVNARSDTGFTALWFGSVQGHISVVKLLVERGGDPTLAGHGGTPLMGASFRGHVEVVRFLLGHASVKATINYAGSARETALWRACYWGRGGVVKALLESGADPTIANRDGTTPMAIAKDLDSLPAEATAEGRRECVVALEVSFCVPFLTFSCSTQCSVSWLRRWGIILGHGGRRRSGRICFGRPGRWPTSRGASRWPWRVGRGRRGRRWWTSR